MSTKNISADNVAGVVAGLKGVVTVRSSTGIVRILKAGDFVFEGDTFQTGTRSTIHIDFKTGGFATLGADQSLHLDSRLLGAAAQAAQQKLATVQDWMENPGFEALRQNVEEAFARGEDPEIVLEATTEPQTVESDEGSTAVTVRQLATRGEITPGHETVGLDIPAETESRSYYGAPRTVGVFVLPDDAAPGGEPVFIDPHITITPNLPDRIKDPADDSTPDAPVYTVDSRGFNIKVDEAYLPGGTQYDPDVGVQGYPIEFLITTTDGFSSVEVNGTLYSVNPDGSLQGFVPIRDKNGTISDARVVSTGPDTYVLSFTYRQGSALIHPLWGRDVLENVDAFTFEVYSDTGLSSKIAVNVDIVDDFPMARDDVRIITQTGLNDTWVEGNVAVPGQERQSRFVKGDSGKDGGDSPGADGFGTVWWLPGYEAVGNGYVIRHSGDSFYDVKDANGLDVGLLYIQPNGYYHFRLYPNYILTEDTLPITIPYELYDAEGDSNPARLILHLLPNLDVPTFQVADEGTIVHESGLLAGTDHGSAEHPTSTDMTIKIVTVEELRSITVAGTKILADPGAVGLFFDFINSKALIYIDSNGNSVDPATGNPYVSGDEAVIGHIEVKAIDLEREGYSFEYVFTLTAAIVDRPTDGNGNHIIPIAFHVVDQTFDEAAYEVGIKVKDGSPFASDDFSSFNAGNAFIEGTNRLVVDGLIEVEGRKYDRGAVGNVLDNDRSGADGWAGTGWTYALDGRASGGEGAVQSYQFSTEGAGEAYTIGGYPGAVLEVDVIYPVLCGTEAIGSFVMHSDGAYAFFIPEGASGINEDLKFVFTYTVADADGDTATARLELEISGESSGRSISEEGAFFEAVLNYESVENNSVAIVLSDSGMLAALPDPSLSVKPAGLSISEAGAYFEAVLNYESVENDALAMVLPDGGMSAVPPDPILSVGLWGMSISEAGALFEAVLNYESVENDALAMILSDGTMSAAPPDPGIFVGPWGLSISEAGAYFEAVLNYESAENDALANGEYLINGSSAAVTGVNGSDPGITDFGSASGIIRGFVSGDEKTEVLDIRDVLIDFDQSNDLGKFLDQAYLTLKVDQEPDGAAKVTLGTDREDGFVNPVPCSFIMPGIKLDSVDMGGSFEQQLLMQIIDDSMLLF